MGLVLSFVDPEYPNDIRVNWLANKGSLKSAIRLAKHNGLYYSFILKLEQLNLASLFLKEEDLAHEKQKLEELRQTITLLNNISDNTGIDYILIKACTTVPHVPRDVDILVRGRDKKRISEALANAGMKRIYSNEVETSLDKAGYMKVDIYTGINYAAINFIDDAFLWGARIEDEVFGIRCPSLNNEANFLLMLIHTLFGHREMTLLDFLHLKSLRHNMDIDICRKYAYGMGWGTTFELALAELESLHRRIYEEREAIQFPYLFGRSFILRCFSTIEGFNIKGSAKFFFNLSFLLDRFFYELKKLPLYEYGSSNFQSIRHLLNSLNYFARTRIGDRKSDYR